MNNFVLFPLSVILCGVVMVASILANENHLASSTLVNSPQPIGYTQKFLVPRNGLTEEEKHYLSAIATINDILSAENDVDTIMNKIEPALTKFWGDLTNSHWKIEMTGGRLPKAPSDASEKDNDSEKTKFIHQILISPPGTPELVAPGITIQRRFLRFKINSPDYIDPGSSKKVLAMICLGITETPTPCFFVYFHENGVVKQIEYRNDEMAKVKREATWSETGDLIQERTITKPEPFVIVK